MWIAWLAEWSAAGLFIVAAAADLRRRRIPNVVPALLLAVFAVYAAAGGLLHMASAWQHLAIGAALLAVGFVLYLSRQFGAGDAKLIAVAGLWVGPAELSSFLLGLAVCALTLSLCALLPHARFRLMRSELPFAVAIVPPTLWVVVPRALSREVLGAV